jgi:predicted alpha/beta hydrolase
MTTDLRLSTSDGRQLAATLFTPAAGARELHGGVLIAPATGVRRRFYAGFASHLSESGLAVLTLDYRGVGDSRDRPARHDPARMHEWGAHDLAAALAALGEAVPDAPLAVVGHSAGGWLYGLAASTAASTVTERVRGVLTVASQVGYWGAWPFPQRYLMAAFWYGLLPATVGLWGHLPSWVLGGEPLPPGVAREWAAWGRRPGFLTDFAATGGFTGYADFTGDLRAYAIAGDMYAPPGAVARFVDLYPAARSEVVLLDERRPLPERPKHFSVFRPTFRDTLWSEWREWLLARLTSR